MSAQANTNGVDRRDVRRAWDEVATTYAERRDPEGPDADLIEDLLAALPADPLGSDTEFVFARLTD